MERLPCLIDNKICSNTNRRCKTCKLDDCRKTMEIVDEAEAMYYEIRLENLKKELEEQYSKCSGCSHLQMLDVNNKKVCCPYMLNKCILEKEGIMTK